MYSCISYGYSCTVLGTLSLVGGAARLPTRGLLPLRDTRRTLAPPPPPAMAAYPATDQLLPKTGKAPLKIWKMPEKVDFLEIQEAMKNAFIRTADKGAQGDTPLKPIQGALSELPVQEVVDALPPGGADWEALPGTQVNGNLYKAMVGDTPCIIKEVISYKEEAAPPPAEGSGQALPPRVLAGHASLPLWRVLREVYVQAVLSAPPNANVCRLIGWSGNPQADGNLQKIEQYEDGAPIYMVMEDYGGEMSKVIDVGQTVPPARALEIMGQVVRGACTACALSFLSSFLPGSRGSRGAGATARLYAPPHSTTFQLPRDNMRRHLGRADPFARFGVFPPGSETGECGRVRRPLLQANRFRKQHASAGWPNHVCAKAEENGR